MVAIAGVLQEELERLRAAEQSYRKEIAALSKGSIQRKRIKGREYSYLAFRSAGKVVSRYLGRLSSEDIEKLGKEIELRRKQEQMLRRVKKDILQIERMLGGRNPA